MNILLDLRAPVTYSTNNNGCKPCVISATVSEMKPETILTELFQPFYSSFISVLLAYRTAKQRDRLLASSCRPPVRPSIYLSVTLCVVVALCMTGKL